MTREIRLNNPGGIVHGPISWRGMSTLQDDPKLVRFERPEDGVHAIMRDLITYQERHNLYNIRDIVTRWAPPHENNTAAYITDVCARMGINPDSHIDLGVPDNLIRLTQAIVHHENGSSPDPTMPFFYPEEVYESEAKLALA